MALPFVEMTLPEMVATVGYVGVFVMVYVETGIPLSLLLPIPGDTLLFASGILAAQGTFELLPLMLVVIVAAILGDSTGYWLGATYGPKLFEKKDALFMNEKNLARTVAFYEKYGKPALVIARFLPVFRVLVPIFAGVGSMRYRDFFIWNVIGAIIWGVSLPLLGYYLGSLIPDIDKFLLPILLGVVLISFIGILREWRRAKAEQQQI